MLRKDKNKEKEYHKNYYIKNRDKILKYSKEWYEMNRERKIKQYYINNPKIKINCVCCNKEVMTRYKRQKVCSNPECKHKFKLDWTKEYIKDKEKIKQINKRTYLKHKKKRCKNQKEYRKNNKEKVRESDKKTYYKYKKHRDIPPYGSKEHIHKLWNSSYNRLFTKYLKSLNYYFIQEFTPFISKRKFRADFFIPSMNLCVDINSDYWHNYKRFPEKKKEDEEKPLHFKRWGYDFAVINERDLKNKNFKRITILKGVKKIK